MSKERTVKCPKCGWVIKYVTGSAKYNLAVHNAIAHGHG